MSKIINLTPHTVVIVAEDGKTILGSIEPSGSVARTKVAYAADGEVAGFPATRATYGAVEGLPASEDGVFYLVSGMVAAHPSVIGRADVVAPGDLVRNEAGQPVGCKGLKRA